MELDEDEDPGYDSGPFCRHWSDPSDCEELCVCGHKCCEHYWAGNECRECLCEHYTDKEK